jgi:uncharacterized protein YidB (DUF937 family)
MGLFDSVIGSVLGQHPGGSGSALQDALIALLTKGQGGTRGGGGLADLVERFRASGYGHIIDSWIGTGPNVEAAPDDLHQALGPENVDELAQRTGMAKPDLLRLLSQYLPQVVNNLTPNGHLPPSVEPRA